MSQTLPPEPDQPYTRPDAGNIAPPFVPPKKPLYKRAWFWVLIVLALILLVFAGCAALFTGAAISAVDDTAKDKPAASSSKSDTPAAIGETVTSGDLDVTVASFDCGATEIGTAPVSTAAQGQFCIAQITAANTGDKAVLFSDSNLKVLDDQGREFKPDSAAAIYFDNTDPLFASINPGNTLSGKVAFDVPAEFTGKTIVVTSGIMSGDPQSVALP